ncbi:MAG: hypothetical protein J0M04_19840 [Verrucomicrobia bacterium]|nr:hypothetical protein [Verrucomicrobiota bacterium]
MSHFLDQGVVLGLKTGFFSSAFWDGFSLIFQWVMKIRSPKYPGLQKHDAAASPGGSGFALISRVVSGHSGQYQSYRHALFKAGLSAKSLARLPAYIEAFERADIAGDYKRLVGSPWQTCRIDAATNR